MIPSFRTGRPVTIAATVLLLAGCANPVYTIDRYGTAPVTQVHLSCHDTYEVYDRPDAGAMLVATNALNESIAGVCGEGVAGLPKEERLRRAAHVFLEETSNRPACRITRETSLSPLQSEFNYVCAAPEPAPSRTHRKPVRRG